MITALRRYFSNPKRVTYLNITLLVMGVIANFIWQAFCIPVPWAFVLLLLCFLSTAFYPIWIVRKKLRTILGFVNGVSFCVFVYCVVFFAHMNWLGLYAILYLGLGLLTFIPHFFAFQLVWKNLIRPKYKKLRGAFVAGVTLSILISAYFGHQYKTAASEIKQFKQSGNKGDIESYMSERIMGMHFIYHTQFCHYDGWRPPKHDPALIVGMWYNKSSDPLSGMELEERIKHYKNQFPNRKVKFNCSCALAYRQIYHEDEIWD